MRYEIKICGLTNLRDAEAALESGADYLGFVFYAGSPRAVTPRQAQRILARLGGAARTVGVFVNAAPEEVRRTAAECGLYAVQLHGDEAAADFAASGLRLWRAVRVGPDGPTPAPEDWPAERYVLDAAVAGAYGGTGARADWAQAAVLARSLPALLAGGLSPENVREALEAVRPRGVDVSGGVEREPGRKDRRKLRAFVAAVRALETAGAGGGPRGARE